MNSEVVGYDSIRGMTPAVNSLATALDDVADDLIMIKIEVRFDGSHSGFHVVVIAANVAQFTSERRVAEQIAAAVGIKSPRVLNCSNSR